MTRYDQITSDNTKDKKKSLQQLLAMSQTISVFFKVIDDGLWCSSEANTTLFTEKLVQMNYHAVISSGIYTEACKDWRRKPIVDNTWAKFKMFSC